MDFAIEILLEIDTSSPLCHSGTWLVLLGASQSSVWLQQLANTLVPGAFNAIRDNFITDGGGAQHPETGSKG